MAITWEEDPAVPLWLWVQVEERDTPSEAGLILSSAGPSKYVSGEPLDLELPGVANGANRYIIIEARESDNPGLAVLYYGISEPFVVAAGKQTVVEVPLSLTKPETQKFDATIELLIDGESPDTVGLDDARKVSLRSRSVAARTLLLANDPSFSANFTTIDLTAADCVEENIDSVTWSVCSVVDWDLTAALPPLGDGLYSVYARFTDKYGYQSQVHKDSVIVDSTAPLPLFASVSPLVAGAGDPVVLSVTFHEAVETGAGATVLTVTPSPAFGSDFEGPKRVGSSNTYLWTTAVLEAVAQDQNIYRFSIAASDSYGNAGEEQALVDTDSNPVELRIDVTPPLLAEAVPVEFNQALFGIPAGGDESSLLHFDFALLEDNPHPVSGAAGKPCEGTCPRVRLGASEVGTVLRKPALDDEASGRLGFSY